MNIVYYLSSTMLKDRGVAIAGGHGYTYDASVESKRKLIKNAPTGYGYYVGATLQSIAVDQVNILSGRALNLPTEHEVSLTAITELLEYAKRESVDKVLIIGDCFNAFKLLKTPRLTEKFAENQIVIKARELFQALEPNVFLESELWANGGDGCKQASKQMDFAKALLELPNVPTSSLEVESIKDFKNPENDFNKLVTASRWFFNTGDNSTFYQPDEWGYRQYCFGRIDPQKNYYGKATPDVYYSSLFTKEPIVVLDKLYNFCRENKPNPYNILAAGNIDMIKSKEISRVIDVIPGVINKNELIASMAIGINASPVLVDFIDPPGLSYRIKDFQHHLSRYHEIFRKRDENNEFMKHRFVDITHLLFEQDEKGKWKINSNFTMNTLTIPVPVVAPGCLKPVTINLAVKYDMPDRSPLNSLLLNKIPEFKVWVGLDFNDDAGVAYYTVVDTPNFTYLHANSCANLRVYSLKELGLK
ncbi:ribonuclease H1 [Aeromonas phage AerS_266]|nr:ribonuclease H1 [Aeromonas phage AerS_266]